MSLIEKLKKVYLKCEDALMSNYSCLCCEREVPSDSNYSLCSDCYKKLNKISGRLCTVCGDSLAAESMECMLCNNISYSFASNQSCFYYDETAGTIIKSYKYGGRKYYAEHIAKLMFDNLNCFKGIDLIVYVPISKNKNKLRGFNQSELLAKHLSKLTGIKVIDALSKDEVKFSQAGLSREARLKNLSGTFHIKAENNDKLKGKNILIIDDVFTTGSTLSECAKELKKAKPKKIITATFAKTKLNSLN